MSDWRPAAGLGALQARAHLLASVRHFFAQRSVMEVQTPVLGAATVTDPDVESIAVPGYGYLQTSPEYFLKRLLVAGVPDCYQLGPVFRADERGRLHNTEFTLLEWYRLGFDHVELMDEVAALVDEMLGPASYITCSYGDLVGDLSRPRDRLDLAFAEACATLPGRIFVTDYPAEQAALARVVDGVAARFELIVDGVELANGYWELTDPRTHRVRFATDHAVRGARGTAKPPVDETFLDALDEGLPDCAGVALGFDRLLMLKLGAGSLDEVLAFRG